MPPRERRRPPIGSMLRPKPEALMSAELAPTPVPARKPRGRVMEDPVYLSARVERELRDDFQRQAIAERRPVGELLNSAVREYLASHRPDQAE